MARKSLQDLSGIANTIARSGTTGINRPSKTGAPALGALQGSLAAIREIDPLLVDDWGPADRLEEFTAVNLENDQSSFEALKASISTEGQQVPILVRRSTSEGRYEAIYGRRRLKACGELGIKVRANVQDLDDATALLAKGLENAVRRNLSFYEKARFAEAIQTTGYDASVAKQVLNLSASGLSHLVKVTQNVPREIGDLVGAAPRSGRPKWTALAALFTAKKLSKKTALNILTKIDVPRNSDTRLDLLLKEGSKLGTQQDNSPKQIALLDGVTLKSGREALLLSVKKSGTNADFAAWLDDNLAEIIQGSYSDFTAASHNDEPSA